MHPELARSRPMYLSGSHCNSPSAEAKGLVDIAGHSPTPPFGVTHYHRQRPSPAITIPTSKARSCLIIQRLLIYVLLVPFQWDELNGNENFNSLLSISSPFKLSYLSTRPRFSPSLQHILSLFKSDRNYYCCLVHKLT
ncbi:hypothetical protein AVEN_166264-1 [Araneus ventricosus]|uniref:Uncharacterized protein n=1 Tax=Araneus ventricosus TaxID=182803 RepID=A0A4Y2IU13_ARAVE|nr:hypothetical protein AVEN_166264-1 [Araneus ventricosus]